MLIDALILCEESQAVCLEFRKLGYEAFSCDILPCSGGHPEWHLQMDAFEAVKKVNPKLTISFPPCTDLSVSGASHFWYKRENGSQERSIRFFFEIWKISNCTENPVGILNGGKYIKEWFPELHREMLEYGFPFKPDQIIQPYEFGHSESKATCLWLRDLPLLQPTDYVDFKAYRCKCGNIFELELGKYGCCDGPAKPLWDNQTRSGQNKIGPSKERGLIRSKTYSGIAYAMANQWTLI